MRMPYSWAVRGLLTLGCLVGFAAGAQAAHTQHWTEPYNVTWTTPSRDAAGSLPLGNGEVGINLWVEEDGALQFYISRSDSLSEISRLLKIGRVRVSLTPNPFRHGAPFRQELKLRDGVCEIVAGEGAEQVKLQVFVDADRPVVHCLGESASPVRVRVEGGSWRTERRALAKGEEENSAWTMHNAPFPLWESADLYTTGPEGTIAWYHRNLESVAVPSTLKVQSLEAAAGLVSDPLLGRTFGGWVTGAGFKAAGAQVLETPVSLKRFAVRVACPCLQTTAGGWATEAHKLAAASANSAAALRHTQSWWQAFWERSWVVVANQGTDRVSAITRGYTLQRYMQACGGRGTYPIKFNGGIFTVEPKTMGKPFNADWRAWGDCHWWQNVRHAYHPMLASGDLEMTEPLFRLYESVRPLCEARAKAYHGAQGCYFPETMTVWGTYSNGDYGWDRNGHQPKDVLCPWWQYAWNQGPELVDLMLDRWDYSRDEAFLKQRVLPMAESVLKYFDTRFRKAPDGQLILAPTQAVETFWEGVTNDTPTVAGLNEVTRRLCALPPRLTTPTQREFFTKMQAACPAVSLEPCPAAPGRKIAPAERYGAKRSNCENPELYAVWPCRVFGLGKPGLEEARAAYATRANHLDVGWGYDGNCAALLGLSEEAGRILQAKCANSNRAYRWPATWGPNFDWLPDQNHGGNLLETTQLMLLQDDGQKLRLLPAWPRAWDVSFKLHAPGKTVVECVYRGGKIEKLQVTPRARAKDVLLPEGVTGPKP
jgi:hypothetical protein